MGIMDGMKHFKNGEEYYRKADEYEEYNQEKKELCEKAINEFNQAINNLDPEGRGTNESYKAYLSRGHAHRANRHIDLAVKDFKMACNIRPGDSDAEYYLELAMGMQMAKEGFEDLCG